MFVRACVCVCGNPVSKDLKLHKWLSLKDNDVLSYTFWIAAKEKQGAAGLPSELRPTRTSDGRCENVPAEQMI